jgi:hypothetical protein
MLRASVDYALRIGNSLKLQVFESLRHIAQGFLDDPRNNLQPDPVTLKAIYDNSLILLYRLLFVFYAEARELLPVRESTMYRDQYSLRALTHDIADDVNRGRAIRQRLPSRRAATAATRSGAGQGRGEAVAAHDVRQLR